MPLTRATTADIPAIRAIEQRPDNEGKIGAWTEDEHRATMARSGVVYFVRHANSKLAAFAILERLDDVRGWTPYLRRIAVAEPGAGVGTPFLTDILDWLFAETNTQKLELRVRVGNPAQHLYERLGFIEEGVMSNRPDPSKSTVMTLLRTEWLAPR